MMNYPQKKTFRAVFLGMLALVASLATATILAQSGNTKPTPADDPQAEVKTKPLAVKRPKSSSNLTTSKRIPDSPEAAAKRKAEHEASTIHLGSAASVMRLRDHQVQVQGNRATVSASLDLSDRRQRRFVWSMMLYKGDGEQDAIPANWISTNDYLDQQFIPPADGTNCKPRFLEALTLAPGRYVAEVVLYDASPTEDLKSLHKAERRLENRTWRGFLPFEITK